jgi:hypothetical protein
MSNLLHPLISPDNNSSGCFDLTSLKFTRLGDKFLFENSAFPLTRYFPAWFLNQQFSVLWEFTATGFFECQAAAVSFPQPTGQWHRATGTSARLAASCDFHRQQFLVAKRLESSVSATS